MAIEQNHRVKAGQIVGLGDFARLIGRTENYVRDCINNGMPVAQRGDRGTSWQIETGPAIWWMMQWSVMQAQGAERYRSRDPKTRKELAQAELAEMQVALKRGELAPVGVMRAGMEKAVAQARARLLSIPSKLARQVAGMKAAEAKEAIEAQIHEALAELANAEITLEAGPDEQPQAG
jgi:terminase small subunit / prophage DNA-packing protein